MSYPKLPIALAAAALMALPGEALPHDEARAARTPPARLLFWSGFEDGVSVSAPRDC